MALRALFRAFSREIDPGSRTENASIQAAGAFRRFLETADFQPVPRAIASGRVARRLPARLLPRLLLCVLGLTLLMGANAPAQPLAPDQPPAAASTPPSQDAPPPAPAPATPAASSPAVASPAAASSPTSPQAAEAARTLPDVSQKDIRALLRTLKDDGDRAEFVKNLQTLLNVASATPNAHNDWLSVATRSLSLFSTSVLGLASDLSSLPDAFWDMSSSLSDQVVIENITHAAIMIAIVLVAALATEGLLKLVLVRPRRAIEAQESPSSLARAGWLTLRTVVDLVPIVAFAAVAFGVLAFVDLTFAARLAVVTVINANVLARVLLAAGRAVLAPRAAQLRLVPLDSESAAYGFLWIRRFTYTAVYGYFLLRAAWILGLPSAIYGMFADLLALVLAGMAVVFILQVRRPVARALRSLSTHDGHVTSVRNQIADLWHLFAIAYVITVYIVWAAEIDGGLAFIGQATALSLIAVAVARVVQYGLYRTFEAVFRLNEDVRQEFPLLEARANRYLPIFKQSVSVFIGLVTALVLLEIWGAEPFEWLATDEGQDLLGRGISIFIVVAGTFLAWELGVAFVDRLYERNPGSTRLKTLLPFLQNGFRIVLITIAGLMVLSELGVNIAPLLAGAGVLGLAVGFGAQTMVKDVITGMFILMEDTLSVGDVVEFGNHSGLVEKITIRTVHLRDFDGNLHSLPFGEMQIVKNMSKQFAYAVVDVRVSYRENIDEALSVMEEVARDMSSSGPLAETIIGPFELMGVEGLQDSAVWLRGRFKTRPLGQWNVRREFYRRIKAAFDARDIEIPFPHQTIYFGADKKGEAPPLHLVRDAAPPRPARKASVAAAVRAAHTPGPLAEEHPGARERPDPDAGERPAPEPGGPDRPEEPATTPAAAPRPGGG